MSTDGTTSDETSTPQADDLSHADGAPMPIGGDPAPDAEGTPEAERAPDGERASAPDGEPSHEAVGIGVIDAADHHGQDEGRDTLTVGEAQRTPGGLGTEQEQRLPAMSQNDAPSVDKVSGIVVQTRSDVGTEPVERIADVLRQRLEQSGIDLPDNEVQELARQISTGDASEPDAS